MPAIGNSTSLGLMDRLGKFDQQVMDSGWLFRINSFGQIHNRQNCQPPDGQLQQLA